MNWLSQDEKDEKTFFVVFYCVGNYEGRAGRLKQGPWPFPENTLPGVHNELFLS